MDFPSPEVEPVIGFERPRRARPPRKRIGLVRLLAGFGLLIALSAWIERSLWGSPARPSNVLQIATEPNVGPPLDLQSAHGSAPGARAPTSTRLAPIWESVRNSVVADDQAQLSVAAQELAAFQPVDAIESAERDQLERQVLGSLDRLRGTEYIDVHNTAHLALMDNRGRALVGPSDMSVGGDRLYVLDSGQLYSGKLPLGVIPDIATLLLEPILSPQATVAGFPIKELVAVEAQPDGMAVFVLDKSNDVYRFEPTSQEWQIWPMAADRHDDPSPMYLSLATFDARLYVLDPARNQVWRSPPSVSGDGVLPGTLPWLVSEGEIDVSDGVDMAIDGDVLVLMRSGRVVSFPGNPVGFDALGAAADASSLIDLNMRPSRPSALALSTGGTELYVADPGHRRVIVLRRADGSFLRQWIAAEDGVFDNLYALAVSNERLFMLSGPQLWVRSLSPSPQPDPYLLPELPVLTDPLEMDPTDVPTADLAPNDPRLPAHLASHKFVMPIKGALLPDRNAVYPGSRRSYRYGVHEGLDLFAKDIGVALAAGTPVLAIGDGKVISADHDYREMSLGEVTRMLDAAHSLHITPLDSLAKLNGRQVWIDHGDGVASRYSHLSGVADGLDAGMEVHAGQLLGYVGLSGTPDGIIGNTQFPHLHLEIRVGGQSPFDHYLGKWLTTEQTRRVFEQVFRVPVRPAYQDERGRGGGS